MTEVVSPALADELRALGEFDADACMNCGVCPLEIDLLPRRLFRHALLGLDARVRADAEPVFSCLLCGACEQSCPAGVHITDNVRVLRRWLLEEASR